MGEYGLVDIAESPLKGGACEMKIKRIRKREP
jgi:hypothetical protein